MVPDDGEEDDWDGGTSIALDEGVASRPVVDVVNETVIVQSSDATITVQEIGQQFFHRAGIAPGAEAVPQLTHIHRNLVKTGEQSQRL